MEIKIRKEEKLLLFFFVSDLLLLFSICIDSNIYSVKLYVDSHAKDKLQIFPENQTYMAA